jgi:hypothetical protein
VNPRRDTRFVTHTVSAETSGDWAGLAGLPVGSWPTGGLVGGGAVAPVDSAVGGRAPVARLSAGPPDGLTTRFEGKRMPGNIATMSIRKMARMTRR